MDQLTPPIRWGIIGCGDVTEVKSGPAYQQVEGFELHAVMARTPGKAQDFAKRHQVPKFYENAQTLIDDPEIDAIYIATPPDSHHEIALQVAQAGKVCSIEKPMALTFAECEQINQAFEKHNTPLFVAYYRRCLPAFQDIKHWIDSGQIGEIRHLDWQYTRPPSELDLSGQSNWRTEYEVAKGGYFDDIACHGLDIFTYLMGNVSTANGIAINQQKLYTSCDAIVANMLFESGATATCCWNFASECKQDKVTISGSKGKVTFGIFSEETAELVVKGKAQHVDMHKPSPIQLDYVRAMRDQLFEGKTHPNSGESAAHTSWIMDQILADV